MELLVLDQIMKFAKKLNKILEKTAKKLLIHLLMQGERLKTAMDRLKLAVGKILQPIGAAFQKSF